MSAKEQAVDHETKSEPAKASAAGKPSVAQNDQSVDEFFTRLQSDMRRPDLSQEAISAAFQAIQKLALDSDAEVAVESVAGAADTAAARTPQAFSAGTEGTAVLICQACNAPNREDSRFCAACGVPLNADSQTPQIQPNSGLASHASGDHHYHHHYHHHYFPAAAGMPQMPAADFRAGTAAPVTRDTARLRTPPGVPIVGRVEAAVRKISQDWAHACNTKHLDDLVDLYGADALVLRPNFPPIRGTAAIREFYFAALDAGLGEAELDPVRVELLGDVAFEAGRCKTLVPTAIGKRREDRGKYLIVSARQAGGDWKVIADCWSSDLILPGADSAAKPAAQTSSGRKT